MKKHMVALLLLIFSFYCMAAFPSPIHAADVTLSAGNGSGLPDSLNNVVEVSLNNPSDIAVALQMDICDEGDYLTCSSCELTVRSEGGGVQCAISEFGNGCCRVLVYDNLAPFHAIQEGSGSIITLRYDVSPEAPLGSCQNLVLENVEIVSCIDNGTGGCFAGPPFTNVGLDDGQFCFTSASSSIPTLSEWGIIIFMTIIMGIGAMFLLRKRIV
jgi:hypothetical protein